jgi:lipoate-protein ligase A
MPSNYWQLIVDPPLDGVENMTVDARLLDEVDGATEPVTILRFYSWARPTLSLGRSQRVEKAVDMDFCGRAGIDVVHRPTGGRAVLHDDELTYAVASNDASQFDGGSIYGTYRRISEALASGYRRLGVEAVLAPETRRPRTPPRKLLDDPCFVSPSRYELLAGGRKIVGSAQRRLRRGFLQHGSMPITCDRERLARATAYSGPRLEKEMAGVAESLDRTPSIGEMRDVFLGAFRDHFAVEFEVRSMQTSL